MGVQVDQPRHHQPAGRINRVRSALRSDGLLNPFHQAEMDCDIALAPQWARRIEDVPTLYNQIIFLGWQHSGAARRGPSSEQGRNEPRVSKCETRTA